MDLRRTHGQPTDPPQETPDGDSINNRRQPVEIWGNWTKETPEPAKAVSGFLGGMRDFYHEHEDRMLLEEHAEHPERFHTYMNPITIIELHGGPFPGTYTNTGLADATTTHIGMQFISSPEKPTKPTRSPASSGEPITGRK